MMIKDYRRTSSISRRLFLYDTFSGMATPSVHDVSADGTPADTVHRRRQRASHNDWAYAPRADVVDNFKRYGLLDDDVIFVEGNVEEPLRDTALPDKIALLRLDTDWYQSTKIELEVFFPRLVPGGVLLIDDYGTWTGARQATDEYFSANPLMLMAVDRGCRIAIRT